jgi:hypothetical protein
MIIQGGEVLDSLGPPDLPSWPHQRSRVQSTARLTRDVAKGGTAIADLPGREQEEARDLFSDIARRGWAARLSSLEEA